MRYVIPKKSLGQHFLRSEETAARIADSLALTSPMSVLEVGPGMGVLTRHLLDNPLVRLTCVELDKDSVSYLAEHMPQANVIHADFLKTNIDELFSGEPYAVIGNYPYNISSQIFFKVLEHRDSIPLCCGMVQKEVAERLAAKPGSKAYGIISVLLQAYYDIEYLFTVPPEVFDPPPKVMSAVIRMRRNAVSRLDCDETLFKTIVKTTFNQRRKMMRGSLKALLGNGHPLLADNMLTMRPEQLSVQQFVELTNKAATGNRQLII
jgi:16S rRNA (adenine1518-N6/adenine1519-N6)-dimethyltransferase